MLHRARYTSNYYYFYYHCYYYLHTYLNALELHAAVKRAHQHVLRVHARRRARLDVRGGLRCACGAYAVRVRCACGERAGRVR